MQLILIIIIIIIIKGIYIAQVRKGHKCAMSAEMAVWLRNCLWLWFYDTAGCVARRASAHKNMQQGSLLEKV